MTRLIHELEGILGGYERRELAATAMELSIALAQHRSTTVQRGYYDDELLIAAYCAHFLPWNIYRLAYAWRSSPPALVEAAMWKPKEERPQGEVKPLLLEDWGAGPLVGLLALWVVTGCEGLPLRYRAVERNHEVMRMGQRLVHALGINDRVEITTVSRDINLEEPIFTRDERDRADLLLVSQAFNEWLPHRGRSTEPIVAFAKAAMSRIERGGELFVMEPASRVVSWGVMELRTALRDRSRQILAPCTHYRECPLLDPRAKSWCHFRQPVEINERHARFIADTGLIELTKETVSYSYLHVANAPLEQTHPPVLDKLYQDAISLHSPKGLERHHAEQQNLPEDQRDHYERKPIPQAQIEGMKPGRVLSDPIKIAKGMGIYVCGPDGRLQMDTAAGRWPRHLRFALRQDATLLYTMPERPFRDDKSRAIRIKLSECVLPQLAQDDLQRLIRSREERERGAQAQPPTPPRQ